MGRHRERAFGGSKCLILDLRFRYIRVEPASNRSRDQPSSSRTSYLANRMAEASPRTGILS